MIINELETNIISNNVKKEPLKTKANYIIKIICILLYIILITYSPQSKSEDIIPMKNMTIIEKFIFQLNEQSIFRIPIYILFFDYLESDVCPDINAYLVFKYYLEHNYTNAYYVINDQTEFYKELLIKNETKNIIPYDMKKNDYFILFPYILNSKIIVQSYVLLPFQTIINQVKFLKFLYLTHAINYFKEKIIKIELEAIEDKKRKHIILSSPYEYNLYKKMNLYEDNSLHIAGLPRYDRFEFIKKNDSENDCLLISFTYRKYNNSVFQQSLYKKNIEKLLGDKEFISFLKNKNIDLIYSQHHYDLFRNRTFKKEDFPNVIYSEQNNLAHYIEQCSLYITDFSTVSFDFMLQNKPVLFYFIDANDTISFDEKEYMNIDKNNSIYFENVFYEQEPLIENIKYYINNNYKLKEGLANKYVTLFYTKKNITGKIYDIINQMISD